MWLLLLALPLQGFAAATLRHCGSGQHQRPAAVAAGPAATHHAAAGHAQAQAHHATAGAPTAQHQHAAGKAALATTKCSACAACCMGVALPAAAPALVAVAPAMPPAGPVATRHVDFLADGLDRPPRLRTT